MNTVKYYLMYVGYTRKVYMYYLGWNNMFRVDERIISMEILNHLISFWIHQYTSLDIFRSKYMWYDENYHYISIVIVLFCINMNNFIEKTHKLINFRCKTLIFHKYYLTCPKGVHSVTRDLELSRTCNTYYPLQ